jgi:N-sulfoglucosamine sulfohydrolase
MIMFRFTHLTVTALVFAVGFLSNPGRAAPAESRNILLLIGDDHGLDAGCYGHPVIKTPGLDRLAAAGTRFTQAFACVSSCSSSRAVILTGQHTHTNGQYGLAHGVHNVHSFDNVRSLSNVLREAGYHTAIIGKYHVKPHEAYRYDEHLPCPGGPRSVANMAKSVRKFLDQRGDKPFYREVGFVDPHRDRVNFGNERKYPDVPRVEYDPTDMIVPPWLPDTPEVRAELAEYAESVSRLDYGIGRMLDALRDTGHQDDTLVIYVSDNGPAFPGAKTTLYDPGIHLPLIIASPAQKQRSGECHAMVSFVDILPTILDWAGVDPPKNIAGRSLLPILEQTDPAGWDTVFASHQFHEITMYYPMRMIRTRDFKYIYNYAHELPYPFASDLFGSATWQAAIKRGPNTGFGCRTIKALLHRPQEELYDLRSDPNESRNLAEDPAHAETLNELRRRLHQWQKRTKDPWLILNEHNAAMRESPAP